jgi:hypothetical protein
MGSGDANVSINLLEANQHQQSHSEPCGLLWQSGLSRVWQTERGLRLEYGNSHLSIEPQHGYADGALATDFWTTPRADQRDFFLRSLLMLVRPQAIYGLHANAVVYGDKGMLLIGHSGSGKTTLTLSLLQSGWHYLGDDVVALRQLSEAASSTVEALALQRGCAVTPRTIGFFPHLQPLLADALDPVRQKRQVLLQDAFSAQFAPTVQPKILLFPVITGEAQSWLTTLSETSTMIGLMEQSAGILIDSTVVATQVEVLRHLLQQTQSYRLHLGRDVYEDPAAVAALLGAL